MQTNEGQQGRQQDARQPLNNANNANNAPLPAEQESTGRGTSTGNATGFTDPAHGADVEKNRDARRNDPNDLGDAGDYSR